MGSTPPNQVFPLLVRSRASASPLNSILLIEAMITCRLRDSEPHYAMRKHNLPLVIGRLATEQGPHMFPFNCYVPTSRISQCPTSCGPIKTTGIQNSIRTGYAISSTANWPRLRVQIPCREFKSYQCAILGLIRLDWSVHYIIH
jgi:hypothetical protein